MSSWVVRATAFDDPDSSALLWDYIVEMVERRFGEPADDEDVARRVRDNPASVFAPPDGVFLVAYEGAAAMGCAGLVRVAEGVGELNRVFVRKPARGRGCGGALLAAVEEQALRLGIAAIRLDTRHDLVEARGLYAKHGYREVPAFNDLPYAEHWFEKRLVRPSGAGS